MYELYDPVTLMFFFRNKHMMCDFGTGNNNKLNWVLEDKQELIDIIETIYRGAKKGRGLVVSPKGEWGPSRNAALHLLTGQQITRLAIDTRPWKETDQGSVEYTSYHSPNLLSMTNEKFRTAAISRSWLRCLSTAVRDSQIYCRMFPTFSCLISLSLDDTTPRELLHFVLAHNVPFQTDISILRGEYPITFVRAVVKHRFSIANFELLRHQ